MTQDTKDRILEWIFSQGTSTVLLVAILSFMAYEKTTLEPARSAEIAAESSEAAKAIADQMATTSLSIAQKHSDAVDRIIAANERERLLYMTMLDLKIEKYEELRGTNE